MSGERTPPEVKLGAARFARRSFHAAHEDFEAAWRRAEGEERAVLQALVQAAAAFHHLERGRLRQTSVLLGRALGKLDEDLRLAWIDVPGLRSCLEGALEQASAGVAPAAPDLQSLLS